MAESIASLSDEALGVFAFAAYHQLTSGQVVRSVAHRDGAGHKASDKAVAELQERGLIETGEGEIRFTNQGEEALQTIIARMRNAGGTQTGVS